MKVRLTSEEKLALLRRIEDGERPSAVAREAGVLRKSLYEWRATFRLHGAAGLDRPPDKLAQAKKRIAELERLVGRQQADLAFFREALRSWDEKRRGSGAPISSRSSKK
jgi:transposase